MTTASYLPHFREHFCETYFPLLANKVVNGICRFSPAELFCSPHLLMYGVESTVQVMYVDAILSRIFGTEITAAKRSATYEVSVSGTKHACPYTHSPHHVEIDMEALRIMGNAERHFIAEFITKHIATMRNVRQEKHIVVLHNCQAMQDQTMYALRRPVESCTRNVLFIFTTQSLGRMEPALKSRCMHIKCVIPASNVEAFWEKFVEDAGVAMNDDDQIEIDPAHGIVKNILRLSSPLTLPATDINISAFLNDLLQEKSIVKAVEKIRVFAFRILQFAVPISRIMRACITHLCDVKGVNVGDVAILSAQLEYKSQSMSKHAILVEKYFLELYMRYGKCAP